MATGKRVSLWHLDISHIPAVPFKIKVLRKAKYLRYLPNSDHKRIYETPWIVIQELVYIGELNLICMSIDLNKLLRWLNTLIVQIGIKQSSFDWFNLTIIPHGTFPQLFSQHLLNTESPFLVLPTRLRFSLA